MSVRTKYDPIGRCIYCGSTVGLSMEHIVPAGLGGRWELPESSCEECRLVTHQFETEVLRTGMWPVRRVLGIRSRRRKEGRRDLFPIMLLPVGSEPTKIELPTESHPGLLVTPIFPRATFWPDAEPQERFNYKHVHVALMPDTDKRLRKAGIYDSISIDFKLDIDSYGRMLAKIAHGIVVATFGSDSFRPYLPGLILGKDTNLCRYIETLNYLEQHSGEMHKIEIGSGTLTEELKPPFIIGVTIRLFSKLDTPTHLVLAGEFTDIGLERFRKSHEKLQAPSTYRSLFRDPRVHAISDN